MSKRSKLADFYEERRGEPMKCECCNSCAKELDKNGKETGRCIFGGPFEYTTEPPPAIFITEPYRLNWTAIRLAEQKRK